MTQQVEHLTNLGVKAVRLLDGSMTRSDTMAIKSGQAAFIFTSPEVLFPTKGNSKLAEGINVVFESVHVDITVIDECHTMLDWYNTLSSTSPSYLTILSHILPLASISV